MTNYSKVMKVLRAADKPLSCKEIAKRSGVRYKVVNQVLNRHQNKFYKDESMEKRYSVMWQLRKQKV